MAKPAHSWERGRPDTAGECGRAAAVLVLDIQRFSSTSASTTRSPSARRAAPAFANRMVPPAKVGGTPALPGRRGDASAAAFKSPR